MTEWLNLGQELQSRSDEYEADVTRICMDLMSDWKPLPCFRLLYDAASADEAVQCRTRYSKIPMS
jgi:hypothetical protein